MDRDSIVGGVGFSMSLAGGWLDFAMNYIPFLLGVALMLYSIYAKHLEIKKIKNEED